MLKGKILKITAQPGGSFKVGLGKVIKICPSTTDLVAYIIKVLDQAKDKKKKALLLKDVRHFLDKKTRDKYL